MARQSIEAQVERAIELLPDQPETFESYKARVLADNPAGGTGVVKHLLMQKLFQASFTFEGTKPVLMVQKKGAE